MREILFSNRSYKSIIFNISMKADFQEILKKMGELHFPCDKIENETVTYAILELINNSLRAHRERSESKGIYLRFQIMHNGLFVTLKDWGGGFNPELLPYDISLPPTTIDVNSEGFQEYREHHKYQRFGMGLLVGKKVFPHFRILFFDRQENFVEWNPDIVAGTFIEMGIGAENAE